MKASFPPFASCFPPWSGFASPALICDQRATGAFVECGNSTQRLAIVGQNHPPKGFPLEGKLSAKADFLLREKASVGRKKAAAYLLCLPTARRLLPNGRRCRASSETDEGEGTPSRYRKAAAAHGCAAAQERNVSFVPTVSFIAGVPFASPALSSQLPSFSSKLSLNRMAASQRGWPGR